MTRRAMSVLLVVAVCAAAGPARATPSELRDLVSAAQPAGCSNYRFLFWDFYRAELWSDAQELPGESFGLSLIYRSEFSRSELVKSSIEEMARISGQPEAAFAAVRTEMEQSFRDVAPGDRITAWRAGPDRLRIFVNGEEMGALTQDIDRFLSIWLGAETRHPNGREALLSGRCDG